VKVKASKDETLGRGGGTDTFFFFDILFLNFIGG
jgi:hypothetical protein